MPPVITLVRKDLLRQVRDVKGLLLYLIAPLFLTTIMGMAFGGGSIFGEQRISAIPLALAGGDLPEEMKERLAEGLQETELFAVTWTDTATAGRLVERGDAKAALILPDRLGDRFFTGEDVEIGLLKDPNSPVKAGLVELILTDALRQFQAGEAAYRSLWPEDDWSRAGDAAVVYEDFTSGDPRRMLRALRRDDGQLREGLLDRAERWLAFSDAMQEPAVTFVRHDRQEWEESGTAGAGSASLYDLFLPTFAVFFMMWGAANIVRELHRERENRTLARLLVGPVSGREITLAKWVTALLVGASQLLLLLLFGWVLFGVNIGHAPLAVLLVAVAAGAAAASVYLVLGMIVRTEKALDALTTVFTLVSGMIGGNFFPVDAMGPTLLFFGRATFNYWANRAYSDLITHGRGLEAVVGEISVLVAIAAIGLTLAMLLFSLRQRRGVLV
ncbi:ABC transporter permease subunit [bacterium]|nr:ABC transporter permease subunit [bacterium]